MKEKFSLKDHLFNAEKVAVLANAIAQAHPEFDHKGFHQTVVRAFPTLELKARIAHIRQCLRHFLPADYRVAVGVILNALPEPLDETRTDNDFGDFIHAPYGDFVAHYGCTDADLHFSLSALREITKRFSAEDAIRYFINAFPRETLATLQAWTQDTNYHVRRLCTEGSRPKLPWSQKISIEPEAALPLLHQLYHDPTRYVTRSVANHLNDIAKINPDLVLKTLKNWQKTGKQSDEEMRFITKHALRTLVKMGHPEALTMLGFGDAANVELTELTHPETVKMGEVLSFGFRVAATETKPLVIDYTVYFQNKQGSMSSQKTFKLQTLNAEKGATYAVSKSHVFRLGMTTRQLYPGTHQVDVQINGSILASFSFWLAE